MGARETRRWGEARRTMCLFFFAPLLLVSPSPFSFAHADDIVIVRSRDGDSERRVSGTVLEYTGVDVLIEHASGREERLPASRIVQVKGAWSAAHREANQLFGSREYEAAEAKYREAFSEEKRPWVRRRVRAQLGWCYRYLGQTEKAVKAFVPIYQEDNKTPHFAAIPLAWATSPVSPSLETAAQSWMTGGNANVVRLIGASWSLSSAKRAEAVQTLRSLARDSDARIVFLAEAQPWRTQVTTATKPTTDRWRQRIGEMPPTIRGGPVYVLGQSLARQDQHEQAALAFMKAAILYPDERDLAAHALLAAARELETMKQSQDATGLYREILAEHATSQVVTEAGQRLEELVGREDP